MAANSNHLTSWLAVEPPEFSWLAGSFHHRKWVNQPETPPITVYNVIEGNLSSSSDPKIHQHVSATFFVFCYSTAKIVTQILGYFSRFAMIKSQFLGGSLINF